jgi:hypothetical protein
MIRYIAIKQVAQRGAPPRWTIDDVDAHCVFISNTGMLIDKKEDVSAIAAELVIEDLRNGQTTILLKRQNPRKPRP